MYATQQSGAVGACWAHNPEVDGSKPFSAMFFFPFPFNVLAHKQLYLKFCHDLLVECMYIEAELRKMATFYLALKNYFSMQCNTTYTLEPFWCVLFQFFQHIIVIAAWVMRLVLVVYVCNQT